MKRVGLLFDSINDNTGDKAMGVVFEQLFSQIADIDLQIIDPLNIDTTQHDAIIVGGGQLLRQAGDEYYDNFKLPGSHILNAIGLLPPVDKLEYLKDYKFVSARTSSEVKQLSKYADKVELIPCMTTLIKSKKYKIKGVKPGEPIVGIHIVPESFLQAPNLVEVINSIPYKKVFLSFTPYNYDLSFVTSLDINWDEVIILDNLNVEQLHSVLGQTKFNLVSSLHATIFSYSQNVPFVTLGQTKTVDYLRDRNLEKYAFYDNTSLSEAIKQVDHNPPNMRQQIQQDKAQLEQVFNHYLQLIYSSKPSAKNQIIKKPTSVDASQVKASVARSVVSGRDRFIGTLILQTNFFEDKAIQKQAEIDHLNNQISELQGSVSSLIASREYKLGWHLNHPLGSFKSLAKKATSILSEIKTNFTPAYSIINSHVLKQPKTIKKSSDLAVVVHVYYTDMWPRIVKQLKNLDKAKINYDLFVSLPKNSQSFAKEIKKTQAKAHVYVMPNLGRDILPFVIIARILIDHDYQSVLKLHTKRSLHWQGGKQWFETMMDNLLPTNIQTLQTIQAKLAQPKIAMIGAADYYYSLKVNFNANGRHLQRLVSRLQGRSFARKHLHLKRNQYGFFAGSMFWARLDAIKPVVNAAITTNYQPEAGQVDGTTAHAVERLLTIYPEFQAKKNYTIKDNQLTRKSDYKGIIPDWSKD